MLQQRAGQHQLEIRVLGVGVNSLAGNLDGAVEDFGFAIGLGLGFITAQRPLAAQIDEFLEGGDGQIGLVLLLVNRAQPFQKNGAIAFFFRGVCAVGVRGQVHHLFVDRGSLIQRPSTSSSRPSL